jgi:glycosyltransferase involved in cell wall biosynthesis
MFVSGFTFVRNAILYDYPVTESIKSLLPLCDEVVVAVGKSDDASLELIRSIDDPKLRIIETVWDANLQSGGRVLAVETEKALAEVNSSADWCFYLQADEVLHEADYPIIRQSMHDALSRPEVDGLLFQYLHFFGSFDYVGVARHWYRNEVRIIRSGRNIKSWRDAQGFRTADAKKLRVIPSGGRIFHYGWVRHPLAQQLKQRSFDQLYHGDLVETSGADIYVYEGREPINVFSGTHPQVMQKRISTMAWKFTPESVRVSLSLKECLSAWLENLTGWRLGEYRNYRPLR